MDSQLTSFQETKIAQAQQVLMLLFYEPNLTIGQACDRVGITERQYRYWLATGNEAINKTRDLIDQMQRELISEIAVAKFKIIRMLINDATNELTKPLDRNKLYETLDIALSELQSVYNVRPGIEEKAQEFLKKGPSIERKQSRFASIDIEETETGFRIGLNEPKDIVDGEISEP